jgi:hypothetical protein
MALSSDYFERIQGDLESAQHAYYNGDMEEAVEYMKGVRAIATEFLKRWNVIKRKVYLSKQLVCGLTPMA